MTAAGRGWTRRTVLGAAAGWLLAACTPRSPTAAPSPTPIPTPTPTPSASPSPSPPPPPYEPDPSEVEADAKRLAGRLAVALTTYTAGEDALTVATRALAPAPTLAGPDQLAGVLGGLLVPAAASSGAVVYPQLGGEGPAQDACSVMVVTRQTLIGADGSEQAATRTMDVRLRRGADGAWAFEALASDGGERVARSPDLPPAAVAVLDDPRIVLPDSARWDIHAGRVAEPVLTAMAVLAGVLPYAVTCLLSGHPSKVFATTRTSNHVIGRAVDIWGVDGAPVVLQRADPGTPAGRLLQAALAQTAATEVGGPWDLDGPGGRGFTDRAVHHDHLHIGFD